MPLSTSLTVLPESKPRSRTSRMARWRALSLIIVHLLMAVHVAHWLIAGRSVAPIEPSEAMYTLNHGHLNAGFIFLLTSLCATAILGRFVCGWGCHFVAYQDLCAWLLRKIGIQAKPFRSRFLVLAPLALAIYMFVWPSAYRWWSGVARPPLTNHLMKSAFWETFPGVTVSVLSIIVCGFVVVYFLGSKGFCTYACPYGGFFRLADRVAPGKIRVNESCVQSGHCTANCTSNVRVHEEVALYGMVVDSGCMKCMDCITVCPSDALYFGFGSPSAAAGATSRKKYTFTFLEEVWMVILGVVSLLIYRGLYDQLPLLLSMAMAGLTAYLCIMLIRMMFRANVRIQNFQLKKGGRWLRTGRWYVSVMIAWLLITVHSGVVQYHAWRGERLYAMVEIPDEVWASPKQGLLPMPASQRISLGLSIRHFELADRWGLMNTPRVLHGLVYLYLAEDRIDEAERMVRRIMAADPDKADGYHGLAGIYRRRGETMEAEIWYRKALTVNPHFTMARRDLGGMLLGEGRLDDAVVLYRESVAMAPNDASAHYNLGYALLVQRRPQSAVKSLTRAVELNPNAALYHYNLGVATFMLGRSSDAEPSIREAIRLAPTDSDAFGFLAVILRDLGDSSGADDATAQAQKLRSKP